MLGGVTSLTDETVDDWNEFWQEYNSLRDDLLDSK